AVFALDHVKDIYSLTVRIDYILSQGTNQLIRQGAGIFLSIEDFQKEMNIFIDSMKTSKEKQKIVLAKLERLVYHCLGLNPKNLEELILDTGLSFAELIENLESLREKGCILEVYKNYFIRSDSSDFV
ncbi:MAG: DNA-protecting protein DprA, partial [Lachnospiraceae bacterium]